jgi:hypothetical protein
MPKRTTGDRPELKPVNVGAAAIDIGSKMHMAAVDPICTDTPVRAFGTFTQDLHDLADWFKACGVISVAIEPGCGLSERLSRGSVILTCWRPTVMYVVIPPSRPSEPHRWATIGTNMSSR